METSEQKLYLKQQIVYQNKWGNITLWIYVLITIGSILCATSASLLAAFEFTIQAAILAAVSTVLISIETTFVFREKWRHHLKIKAEYQSIYLESELKTSSEEEITHEIEAVLKKYSSDMPVPSTAE